MATRREFTLDIRQVIVSSDGLLPSALAINGEDITGFKWDEREWPELDEKKSHSFLPALWDPSRAGLDRALFQSGIGRGDDLKFRDISLVHFNNSSQWFPRIKHGDYFINHKHRFLFSGDSISDMVNSSNNISTGEVTNPTVNSYDYSFGLKSFIPVVSYIYKRDKIDGSNLIETNIRQRSNFTGKIVNGEYLDTKDSNGNILWQNVDTFYDEFIVDRENDKFIFNKDYISRIGVIATTADDVLTCELAGESSGQANMTFNTTLHSTHIDSAEIYVYNNISLTYEKWIIVNDIGGTINLETGVVSSITSNTMTVSGAGWTINEFTGVSLTFLTTVGTKNYLILSNTPDTITIDDTGGEDMVADGAIIGSQYRIFRNIDTTDKAVQYDYDTGNIVFGNGVDYGAIPAVLAHIYITYEVTPKIEYEPEKAGDYRVSELDINPLRLGTNRGFLFLSEADDFVHRIEIAVDKESIGEHVYGPVYLGGDYATISATAYNVFGQTVADAPITFNLEGDQLGFLNGSQVPITVNTDYRGQAFVQYNSTTSLDAISQTTSTLYTSGSNQVLELDDVVSGWTQSNDIYTFQLIDDDGFQPDYRRVLLYKYDANAIDPNKYQSWLEHGAPSEAIDDPGYTDPVTGESLYFKTGGNVPIRPTTISGNKVIYEPTDPIPPITGDVVGYLVTVGKLANISVFGYNDLFRSFVHGAPVSLKVQLPTHMTGAYVDPLNNYVYYGFRFADETTAAASTIGTATFLTVNPAPWAEDMGIDALEDTQYVGTLLSGYGEGTSLTFTIISDGTLGSAVVTDPATGAFTYDPNPSTTGTDTFTFKSNDGTTDSRLATVTVTIT